jgi:sulfonate dioxygenase
MLTGPEAGGDTLWGSGYALYSSLSPSFQVYLEGLSAVHTAFEQAREMGQYVRRDAIESTHPVVRVHPATNMPNTK